MGVAIANELLKRGADVTLCLNTFKKILPEIHVV
jgi:phosphopantothenoylcysteine synthetase/decarboxylase